MQNLKVENGDTVLVRGATSGVGVAFAKLLKARYSKVQLYGSTRSMNKREQLLAAGFDECILDNSGRLVTDMAFDKIADMVEPAKVLHWPRFVRHKLIWIVLKVLARWWY